MQRQAFDASMADRAAQTKMREQQLRMAQNKQDAINSIFGGVTSPIGGVSTAGISGQQGAKLADMTPEQIAMLKLNGVDVEGLWKTSKEGFKRDAGSYYADPTSGAMNYYPQLDKGMMMQNGTATMVPGYGQSAAQAKGMEAAAVAAATTPYTIGIDAAKQRLSADLAPEQIYNPQTGRMEIVPRSVAVGAGRQYQSSGLLGGSTDSAANTQRMIIQGEMDKLPPDHPDRPALMRELSRLGGAQTSGNFAAKPSAREEAAAEVERIKLVEQAKADIVPTQKKQADIAAADQMLNVINAIKMHPGRETGTGMSSILDPRNYMYGTNAYDFKSALKQLEGKTFLEAYQILRGGGAITEKEGAQATNAMARLQTAQSDEAFLSGLNELEDIVKGARDRKLSGSAAESSAGASKNIINTLPTANSSNRGQRIRDTQTGQILVSDGMQWRPE